MASVYLLYSRTRKSFYTGSSHQDNPNQRLQEHNRGKTRSTKSGRPWELVHTEVYTSYTEARTRELFLKSGAGRKWVAEHFSQYKKPSA